MTLDLKMVKFPRSSLGDGSLNSIVHGGYGRKEGLYEIEGLIQRIFFFFFCHRL